MTRGLLVLGLVAVLTGCATPAPTPSISVPDTTPVPTAPQTTDPTEAEAHATGIALPEPATPFDAATLLDAMRDSRRPGGVPDQLETDAIATALAEAIWTLDGMPWTTMAVGASCGPQLCTLEIAGAAAGAQGDDLWVFEIVPASGAVKLVSTDLRSLMPDLVGRLDELARSLFPSPNFEGLALTNARWLPPPDEGRFVLSYRSGDEERSSCGMDLTIDAAQPGIVSDVSMDC